MNMLININSPLSYKLNLTGVSPKASEIIGSIFESTFIQDLNKHVELNPYHDHENVLEHVQKVFANLQELMKFEFIKDENLKQKYLEYLKEKITSQNNLSRGELLLIACSLHDISKTTMLKVVDDVGNTKGTGHEHASATLVPEVLRSSELSAIEVSLIQFLVDRLDTYGDTFCIPNLTFDVEKDKEIVKNTQPLFYIELLLHILADNFGAEVYQKFQDYFMYQLFPANLIN